MSANKLTVGMPVYNGARYLAESITSVLAQTYTDFQLLICDDCSTDDSAQIIHSFHDPRITYVRNPHRMGLVENWNKCVSLSTGEYIYLWHQDDVMLPDNLRRKLEVLDAYPNVGYVHSNIEWIDEFRNTIRSHYVKESARDYVVPGYFFFLWCLSRDGNAVMCPSAMMRAECYARLGGYRKELPLACDYEFFMRLPLYYDVACIGEPLLQVRSHPASETHNFVRRGGDGWKQDQLARKLILTEHSHRIPDRRLVAEIAVQALVREAIDRATRALEKPPTSSHDFFEAWRYFWRAVRLRPGVVTRSDASWVLERLVLGPIGLRMARRVKHLMDGHSLPGPPACNGLPKH